MPAATDPQRRDPLPQSQNPPPYDAPQPHQAVQAPAPVRPKAQPKLVPRLIPKRNAPPPQQRAALPAALPQAPVAVPQQTQSDTGAGGLGVQEARILDIVANANGLNFS